MLFFCDVLDELLQNVECQCCSTISLAKANESETSTRIFTNFYIGDNINVDKVGCSKPFPTIGYYGSRTMG